MSYIPPSTSMPANIPLATMVFAQNSLGFGSYQYCSAAEGNTAGTSGFTGSYRIWLPAGTKIKVVGAIKGIVAAGFTIEIGFQVLSNLRPGGYSAINNVTFTNADGTNPNPKVSGTTTLGADSFILPYGKYNNGVGTFAEEVFCQVLTA